MKSISFAKVLTLGCFALLLPVACGDDDDGGSGPVAGTAGMAGETAVGGGGGAGGEAPGIMIPGTSDMSETIECATDCSSTPTLVPTLFIDPCCTAADTCGVDSGFLSLLQVNLNGACLPKNQPGELDDSCPDSEGATVPFGSTNVEVDPFKGCCRPNGTCGFEVNDINTSAGEFTSPGLGCVDSAAFGAPVTNCGEGAGGGGAGGGGAGGAAGAGGGAGEAPIAGGGGAGGAP